MFFGSKTKNDKSVTWDEYLEIEDIQNGVVKLSNDRYRAYLEIFPIPLTHCSEQEMMAVYHGWRNFLVTLEQMIAIFIQSRQVDLDSVLKIQRENRERFIEQYGLSGKITEQFYIEQESFNLDLMDNRNLPIRRNIFIFIADHKKFGSINEATEYLHDRIEESEHRIKVFSRRKHLLDNAGVCDLLQAWANKKQSRYITGKEMYERGFHETFLVKGVPLHLAENI
jgi:hypothetical protein